MIIFGSLLRRHCPTLCRHQTKDVCALSGSWASRQSARIISRSRHLVLGTCSDPGLNLVWYWSDIGLRLVWDWSGTFWFLKHSFPEWRKQIKPCFASSIFLSSSSSVWVGDHVLSVCCCCCWWLYVSFFASPIVASWVRQLGRWHERVLFCSQPNKRSGDPLMANQTCLPCCSPSR